jgi:GT2 family glycosyltransferase
MSESRPTVAVVIVNFNGGAMIRRAVEGLRDQTYPNFRVIVVDNASSDGSADGLEGVFPERVEVMRLGTNTGFAKANNIGIDRAADCEWIATLNPDAYPAREWLEKLVQACRSYAACSSFGSQLRAANREGYLDGTGDIYSVSGLAWRRDLGTPLEHGTLEPGEIFAPCAAAALYRRATLVELGGFDERYFCYLEDVDLGFRLQLAGHRSRYVPDSIALHEGSAITGKRSDFTVYHTQRNRIWTWVKNMPSPQIWLYLPVFLVYQLVQFAVYAARGGFAAAARGTLDALTGLKPILRSRREIQRTRRTPWRDLTRVLNRSLVQPLLRRN